MNLIPASLSRVVAQQGLMLAKNSPQLLLGAGVVGMIGSTVLACRSTLKLEEVVDKTKQELELARSAVGKELKGGGKYTEEHSKRDIAVIYIHGLGNMAKLYGPAIILGGVSIFALTKSHNILQQRNAALTAAYVAIDSAFKAYRKRVVETYGPEVDRQMRHASEEVMVIDDKGKTSTELRAAPGQPSGYAKFFDEFSDRWSREPEYNLVYLSNKQNYWNDILLRRGHVFLNEVYGDLGIPHTRAGAIVGWVSPRYSNVGDGYVDFGIWDHDNQKAIDFVNGREGSILLDFNVDGPIYDLVDKPEEQIAWQA